MTTIPHKPEQASSGVKVRENIFRQKIIVPVENEHLAGGGSRWIPLNPDGLAVGDVRPVSFTTPEGAASYAEVQGFKVEHSQ